MLYSRTQFSRDQLLTDLLAVKQRLEAQWRKGAFGTVNSSNCIVAAVQVTTEQRIGFTTVAKGTQAEGEVRMGRALVAIYMALFGPKASQDVTLKEVMFSIANFNDGAATHASVLLLLERAIAQVVSHAGATVVAGG